MFLFNPLRAEFDLIQDRLTTPGHGGLKLSFSHFDGYSPVLSGSVRVAVVDSPNSEKSGNITVAINVKASSLSCKDNIRIHQRDNEISISTGGLSFLSYVTAPCLIIDVAISVPRSIGDLGIKAPSVPIFIQSVEKAGDVVLESESSSITVESIEAQSLTVSSHSGAITFKESSKQYVSKFIKVTSSSGSTALRSSLYSPSVLVEAMSGLLVLSATTTARELKVKNSSGSINGNVEYSKDATSVSTYETKSGSLNVTLKRWTGFLTVDSGSGSKHVGGDGLEKFNDGWKKGDGDSKAMFKVHSGSIKVKIS